MGYIKQLFNDFPAVKEAIKIMGQGMLGIFVVMVVIALVVLIFTKFATKKK